MNTDNETLERILDLGIPKGHDGFECKHKFKFRVTFRATVRGDGEPTETSFAYYDLVSARKCYRNILLAFYKGREISAFAICLNHFGSRKWERPIHSEAVREVDG
jgi:hypothetical protein